MSDALNGVVFTRLRESADLKWATEELNCLLPQLSSSAKPLDIKQLSSLLSDDKTVIFIARLNEHIIAVTMLIFMDSITGRKAWIEDVVTGADFRKHGLASRLIAMAVNLAKARGAKHVNLTSRPTRGDAQSLYPQLGFQERETVVFRLEFG